VTYGHPLPCSAAVNIAPGLDALNTVVNEFGAGVVGGLLIGVLLATLVELWQFYEFRQRRRSAEDAFRAEVQHGLDKPQSSVMLPTGQSLVT